MDQLLKFERPFSFTKALAEDGTFEGYASVFDVEDSSGDTVRKGAFKAHLAKLGKSKRKVKMLSNHNRHELIGTYKSVDEDDNGLYVVGKLTLGVQKADETRLLMLDEAIDSMSIGGYVRKQTIDEKTWKRDLLEIELMEISPTGFPALDAARITAVKSLESAAMTSAAEIEAILRDVGGFTVKEAKIIISKAKACVPHRDVGIDTATLKQIGDTIRSLSL